MRDSMGMMTAQQWQQQQEKQLARLANQLANTRSTNRALREQIADVLNRFKQHTIKFRALEKWAEKAAQRIQYIEDIKGKRVPYLLNFQIPLPASGLANPAVNGIQSIAGQQFADQKSIPIDGPFVATHWMGAFEMKTYSLGPTQTRPQDAPPGTEVITPLTGRFRPLASTADPMLGAYIGPGTAVDGLTITGVHTPRPGTIDFLWQVEDEGSQRARQNELPQPSRYLFSELDRPYYLAVSDYYPQGSSVRVKVTPTHELDLIEMAYLAYNGVAQGEQADVTGIAPNRRVFATGGTLHLTMGGYKIIQAATPTA